MATIYTPSAAWTTTVSIAEDGVDDDVAASYNGSIQAALDRTELLNKRTAYEYHIASYNTGTFENSSTNSSIYYQIFNAAATGGFPAPPSLTTGDLAHFDMTGMIYHTGGVGYYAYARLRMEVRFSPDLTWYNLNEATIDWTDANTQLPGGVGTPFRLAGSYQSPVNADNIEARIAIVTFLSLVYPIHVKRTFAFACRVNASAQRIFVP